jgi:hypothetical protein
MADIVIDTSTLMKWYIPEQHHSGNSAEAPPLQGWEKARKLHCTNHRT